MYVVIGGWVDGWMDGWAVVHVVSVYANEVCMCNYDGVRMQVSVYVCMYDNDVCIMMYMCMMCM